LLHFLSPLQKEIMAIELEDSTLIIMIHNNLSKKEIIALNLFKDKIIKIKNLIGVNHLQGI
jgi:hypothetical protein